MKDRSGKRRKAELRPRHWAQIGDPPPAPPGWRVAPPDFVGVGAQRAGTKWWYELIADHPGVGRVATTTKELHFFDQFWQRPFSDAEAARYHGFFPRPEGAIAGEWTPRYMFDFWTPRLLRRAAPEARLLVLLRDPVERYRSGVAREARLAEKRGEAVSPLVWNDAVSRGLYAAQLARLYEHFPPSQVLVLQYERCRRDTFPELRRTYEFLGLDHPDHVPGDVEETVGRVNPKEELPEELRADLVATYEPDVLELAALVPDLDLGLWPNFSHLARSG